MRTQVLQLRLPSRRSAEPVRWDDCTTKVALGADRIAGLQFVFDGHHLVEQAIEPCVLAPEKCLVLFDPDGGETLHELVHRHILEFEPLHDSTNRGTVLPA